ncbi:MAG: 3-isopropylmalate dehydratase small subunit [Elusimicrobiota bacterium]
MILKGKVHRFGDNVNTDEIIPARYLNTTDDKELAKHCLEDVDDNFVKKAAVGDIIVADNNFGCGSSREHAPRSIKAAGISCVIAVSFARIFFRNAINIGLPILELKDTKSFQAGDDLEIDLASGVVTNLTQKKTFQSQSFPPFMQEIIQRGGLINKLSSSLKQK